MITIEKIVERISKYEEVLQSFEYSFSKEGVMLLKEDLELLKNCEIKNKYTKISFWDLYNNYNNTFVCNINALMMIFIDYYFGNLVEPLNEETITHFMSFIRFLLFDATLENKNILLNLRPIRIGEYKNHDEDFYFSQYFSLLSKKYIFECSVEPQEEYYRQFCNFFVKYLIVNKHNRLLIDFYNKNKKYISSKLFLTFLIENKTDIKDDFYDEDLIKIILSSYNQIDLKSINMKLYYSEKNLNNDITIDIDKEGNQITLQEIILGQLIDFFNFLKRNEVTRRDFDKYTDNLYKNKKMPNDVKLYKCQLITTYLDFIFTNDSDKYGNLIFNDMNFSYIKNDLVMIYKSTYPFISISCLDFIEHYIDYLIKNKKNNNNIHLYSLMSLYIKIKIYNNNCFSEDEELEVQNFIEQLNIKLNNLETIYVMKNLYIVNKLNVENKRKIVKEFFEAAFENYFLPNGKISNNISDYSEQNIKKESIDKYIDAIFNNNILVDQLVSGEVLAKPFISSDENVDIIQGDYTNFLACQIKSVERYLKSVLAKYHRNNIYKTIRQGEEKKEKKNKQGIIIDDGRIKLDNIANPTADDLHDLECGPSFFALKYAYKIENKNFPLNEKIADEWLRKIRNGHFHIDRIKTIGELKMKRIKTAYFLIYLIHYLGEYGKL